MPPDDVVPRLQALGPHGGALQKLCDAADWSDPRFLLAVREGLRLRPRIHPRQWEDAAAFLGLAEAGKLHDGTRGIAFGSGREPLTYAVGARVGHLTATDLYEADTAWTVARTADPLGFVLGAAPRDFPRERLAVHHMDMRSIAYPDAHFDFCYSISAFEHIGDRDDFLQHFREVRRVLKPDGIYALTTEVLLGTTTRKTRGNYAFAVHDLLALFADAGLQAAPVVDMRLTDMAENDPRMLASTRHADPADSRIQSLTVRDQAGCASAPVAFLLRPAVGTPTPVSVIGLEQSRAQVEKARIAQRTLRFSDWVRLNPFSRRQSGVAPPGMQLWTDAPARPRQPLFSTAFLDFGATTMECQLVVVPAPGMVGPATIEHRVMAWQPLAEARERAVSTATAQVNATPGGALVLRFDFATAADTVYAVAGRVKDGQALLADIDVQLRRRKPPQPG